MKLEVREGRTVSCWQPVFRLAKSDRRASCRETSKHCLISKVNFSSVKFMVSKTKPEILKHEMKASRRKHPVARPSRGDPK